MNEPKTGDLVSCGAGAWPVHVVTSTGGVVTLERAGNAGAGVAPHRFDVERGDLRWTPAPGATRHWRHVWGPKCGACAKPLADCGCD